VGFVGWTSYSFALQAVDRLDQSVWAPVPVAARPLVMVPQDVSDLFQIHQSRCLVHLGPKYWTLRDWTLRKNGLTLYRLPSSDSKRSQVSPRDVGAAPSRLKSTRPWVSKGVFSLSISLFKRRFLFFFSQISFDFARTSFSLRFVDTQLRVWKWSDPKVGKTLPQWSHTTSTDFEFIILRASKEPDAVSYALQANFRKLFTDCQRDHLKIVLKDGLCSYCKSITNWVYMSEVAYPYMIYQYGKWLIAKSGICLKDLRAMKTQLDKRMSKQCSPLLVSLSKLPK
jgi:hypothetical protein